MTSLVRVAVVAIALGCSTVAPGPAPAQELGLNSRVEFAYFRPRA